MQTEETTELTAEQIEALTADAPAPNNGGSEFVPADAGGVDWVLAKCAAARAEAKLIRENAELMARECERKAEHLEWKYGANLQAWLRAELAGGKKRSIRLFHGVVGFRTKPAAVVVLNPVAALDWAKRNQPEAVLEALDKKALNEDFVAVGEIAGFARLAPAEEQFYIK